MESKYFNFLISLVGRGDKYQTLLFSLMCVPFKAMVRNDENRGDDGLQLRLEFKELKGENVMLPPILYDQCSVLEMMIGVAKRMCFETIESKHQKSVDAWFWILVDNLNLAYMTDEACRKNRYTCSSKFYSVMTNFLNRNYDREGNGGLFPLTHSLPDQRTIEIWYQMADFLRENYRIY